MMSIDPPRKRGCLPLLILGGAVLLILGGCVSAEDRRGLTQLADDTALLAAATAASSDASQPAAFPGAPVPRAVRVHVLAVEAHRLAVDLCRSLSAPTSTATGGAK